MIDISVYLNRITSQHKTKPKYMAFLAARLQPFADLAKCLESFEAAFDLDTASGRQLDIIGQYVGVKRLLNFQPQYAPALLDDTYYRMLLKARISLNNWDGTTTGIHKIWSGIFPDYTIEVVDNQNMTMSVRINGLQPLFDSEIINHGYITPKPMGVLVDYSFIVRITVDTALYAASLVRNRFLMKGLPAPEPQKDNSKPFGELYIGGAKFFDHIEVEVKNKPPSTEAATKSGELYTAGKALLNKAVLMAIDEKPVASVFEPLDAGVCGGGLATARTLRHTLVSAIK